MQFIKKTLIFIFLLLKLNICAEENDFFMNLSSPILVGTEAYIVCNEKNQEQVLKEISTIPTPENGIHIGWSIEFNYKLIAARKPQYAILCDISMKVFDFYEEFQRNLISIEYEDFFDKYPEYIWVTREDFEYIKKMYQENRIHHLCLNLMDTEKRFDRLAWWIHENSYVVDTIYVSNALDWIRRGDSSAHWSQRKPIDCSIYFNNLNKLSTENTEFIHCSYHRGMKLRHSTGFLNENDIFYKN